MDYRQRCLASFAVLLLSAPGCTGDSNASDDKTTTSNDVTTMDDGQASTTGPNAPPSSSQSGEGSARLSLLGSSHARSYMRVFCEGKADDVELPTDPRALIRPGFNEGKAVAFNAYFQDCQGAAGPRTCGEFRARAEAGRKLVQTDLAANLFGILLPAALYNRAWQSWDGSGLTERPADFDEQARRRYGLAKAPFDNPYPLPGEKANESNGGSGQLPLGLRQLRDEEGKWTGTISITCEICHSSGLGLQSELAGSAYVPGMGANTADLQLLFTDMTFPIPIGMNDSPGVTNAMGLSAVLVGMFDQDSLGVRFDTALLLQLPGNTSGSGDTKSPPWWNISHRPRKFWDGGYSVNASRMDSAILNVPSAFERLGGQDRAFNEALRDKVENDSLLIQAYLESLESPAYPWPIDEKLAEQGAVLFHNLDLWGKGANADLPRPPGNGSCAGCHGAYAPRYVNDPEFLADPRLEGMAGYIAPLDLIRTDPERQHGFTKPLLEMLSTGWLSYPESAPGYVPPEAKTDEQEHADDRDVFKSGTRPQGACTWQGVNPEDATGYLAPPLYGIWATGPYLHNASLPDIWSLLSPDDRPAVWRRQRSVGAGSEQGLDTTQAAYDSERLGWKHESLVCGQGSAIDGEEFIDCEPEQPTHPYEEVGDFVQNWSGTLNSLGYQVRQPTSRAKVELRRVFNSHRFAKSNQGHDFTRVLTDPQRRAIIEYLKTL